MESNFNDYVKSQQRSELVRAVAYQDTLVVKDLIRAGADVNAYSRWDFDKAIDAVQVHQDYREPLIKDYLTKYRESVSVMVFIHETVNTGHPSILDSLLSVDADLDGNEESPYAFTPLMIAAALADTEIIRLLILAGANPRASNLEGYTATCLALHQEEFEIAKLLNHYESRLLSQPGALALGK